jgi:chromosome partitioning protein
MTPAQKEASRTMVAKAPLPEAPLRITVGNLKGGVTRSTTSILLAFALQRLTGQRVFIVDADGANGTSFQWSEYAGEDWPEELPVVYLPGSRTLAKRVSQMHPEGHLIIDTGNDSTTLQQALLVTDHLVMPIGATPADAARLTPTLQSAAVIAAVKPIELSILFTRTSPTSTTFKEAHAAAKTLEGGGLRVLDSNVPFSPLYSQAFGTVPKKLGRYDDVLAEILNGGTE